MAAPRLNPSIIEGLKHADPKLYQYLKSLAEVINDVQNQLDPLVRDAIVEAVQQVAPSAVLNFTYTIQSNGLRFDWTAVLGAASYEIREGVTFDTGTQVVVTPTNTAIIAPVNPLGEHTYWIQASNSAGITGTPVMLVVSLPDIGSIVVSGRVIDNNVLLYWTTPTSAFTVEYYNIYKDGVLSGRSHGTFLTFFETLSGTYTYNIVPVDIAGNVGSDNFIELLVNQPPDYVLEDSRVSTLQGTCIDCWLDSSVPRLMIIVDVC